MQMAKTIKLEDVRKLPRGRRPELDPALTKTLKSVKAGQAVVLSEEFGKVAEDDRSKVSQTIRKHWLACRDDKPSVNFSPEGEAQVFISPRD